MNKPRVKNKTIKGKLTTKKKKGKKKHKVINWPEYNQMLVDRGRIEFWITKEAMDNWHNAESSGKAGAPKQYSDAAVSACLTLKAVFHLSFRATEGFVNSLFEATDAELFSPDYSTLSIRQAILPVDIRTQTDIGAAGETLHIVVDSSGAKVYGEGEWKVRQHGFSKRRDWKKFHIALDAKTKRFKAVAVTGNDIADCEMLPVLLGQIENPIEQADADGAYDRRVCYQALAVKQVAKIAIPPQKNARIWQHGNSKRERLPRDQNLRRIREVGRKQWKEESGYHSRSIAENGIFRYKTIFSDRLSARKNSNQQTEILLKCKILNLMADIGMPKTIVAA